MESYEEYLGKITFTVLEDESQLTEEMLFNLDTKQGFVIEGDEGKYDVYISRKFEPMKILNHVSVFESINEYYIIDAFGVIMFKGESNDVIEYVQGFFSEDEI